MSETDEATLFRYGKCVLGPRAGGLVAKLLKAKAGDIAVAMAALETAADKESPRDYVAACCREIAAQPAGQRGTDWW